jgi:uracil-DNA glycosylase family 4
LLLKDVYITATVRCVPPDNKPARDEVLNCRPFLVREIALLKNIRLIVPLGGIALDAYLSLLQDAGKISSRAKFRFAHGAEFRTHEDGPVVLASYHPSQQNTSTGRLTAGMLQDIFLRARHIIEHDGGADAR